MAKTKKMILSFMAGLLILAGCSQPVSQQSVRPMTDEGTSYMAFNETGQEMLKDVYGDDLSKMPEPMLKVGQAMPDLDLLTYDGRTINLLDYKGKNVIVELVAYWCSFCKEETSKEIDPMLEKNDDITFIQVFVEGAKADTVENDDGEEETIDTIKQFYTEAESTVKDKIVVQESGAVENFAKNAIDISVFPTFIFYDSSGKISWVHEAKLTADDLTKIRSYAFDSEDTSSRLYSNLSEGIFSASDYTRKYLDVKNDLTESAQNRLNQLGIDANYGEATFYSNVGKHIESSTKILDLKEQVIDMAELSGNTVYFFVSEKDEHLSADIQVINDFQKVMVNENLNVVTILIPAESGNGEELLNKLQIKPDGYVIDASSDIPEALYKLILFYTPTAIFVNETDKTCTGAYYGTFTSEKLQQAYTVMCIVDPLYKQCAEKTKA